MDDLNFNLNSSVLLPVPQGPDLHDKEQIGGLRVIVRAMQHIIEHSAHTLVTAGHTQEGEPAELSQARCDNVLLFLKGDYDGWANACEQHQTQDYQTILNWLSYYWGWKCDPGDINGEDNESTRVALQQFREAYLRVFDIELAAGDRPTTDDWKAFAALYELAIVEHVKVADARTAINLGDPPTLACESYWPEDAEDGIEMRSSENRRVEFLFFVNPKLPKLHATKKHNTGYRFYGTDQYIARKYLYVEPEFRFYFSI